MKTTTLWFLIALLLGVTALGCGSNRSGAITLADTLENQELLGIPTGVEMFAGGMPVNEAGTANVSPSPLELTVPNRPDIPDDAWDGNLRLQCGDQPPATLLVGVTRDAANVTHVTAEVEDAYLYQLMPCTFAGGVPGENGNLNFRYDFETGCAINDEFTVDTHERCWSIMQGTTYDSWPPILDFLTWDTQLGALVFDNLDAAGAQLPLGVAFGIQKNIIVGPEGFVLTTHIQGLDGYLVGGGRSGLPNVIALGVTNLNKEAYLLAIAGEGADPGTRECNAGYYDYGVTDSTLYRIPCPDDDFYLKLYYTPAAIQGFISLDNVTWSPIDIPPRNLVGIVDMTGARQLIMSFSNGAVYTHAHAETDWIHISGVTSPDGQY